MNIISWYQYSDWNIAITYNKDNVCHWSISQLNFFLFDRCRDRLMNTYIPLSCIKPIRLVEFITHCFHKLVNHWFHFSLSWVFCSSWIAKQKNTNVCHNKQFHSTSSTKLVWFEFNNIITGKFVFQYEFNIESNKQQFQYVYGKRSVIANNARQRHTNIFTCSRTNNPNISTLKLHIRYKRSIIWTW